MLLGYVPWSEFGINGEEVNERCYTDAKFEIELHHKESDVPCDPSIERCDPCIERCGVRFFFAHQDFGEPIVHNSEIRSLDGCSAERSGSDITSDTSDEEEQYLKLSEVFEGANRKPSYGRNEDNDSSRKRKTLERWTQEVRVTSGLIQGYLDDGFSWDCYGSSSIGRRIQSGEYVCTHKPGCWAQAEMRSSSDIETILEITYIGRHTCWKTLPMFTHQVRVTPGMGTESPSDGFRWLKYAQMDISGAKFPRVYYVCTPQNVGGCMAIKEVQRSNDKEILKITYRGRHTCTLASDSSAKWDDSSISAGSDASSIHEQVVQSSSSPGANDHGGNEIRVSDNPVDEDNMIVSRDASPQDMEHFDNANYGGAVSEGISNAVVNQQRVSFGKRTLGTLKSLWTSIASRKRTREMMEADDNQANESNSIPNNNP